MAAKLRDLDCYNQFDSDFCLSPILVQLDTAEQPVFAKVRDRETGEWRGWRLEAVGGAKMPLGVRRGQKGRAGRRPPARLMCPVQGSRGPQDGSLPISSFNQARSRLVLMMKVLTVALWPWVLIFCPPPGKGLYIPRSLPCDFTALSRCGRRALPYPIGVGSAILTYFGQ